MYKQLVLLKITYILLDIKLFVCDIFLRFSGGLIDVISQPIKSKAMIHPIIHIDFKWCLQYLSYSQIHELMIMEYNSQL